MEMRSPLSSYNPCNKICQPTSYAVQQAIAVSYKAIELTKFNAAMLQLWQLYQGAWKRPQTRLPPLLYPFTECPGAAAPYALPPSGPPPNACAAQSRPWLHTLLHLLHRLSQWHSAMPVPPFHLP
eukprot:1095398-Pelagomonas_calceolata.AAC.2